MKDNWYTKPRKFDKFIRWIVFNPKALSILMVMGHIISLLLFVGLFIVSLIFDWNLFWKLATFGLAVITIYNLYKYYKFQRKTGSIFVDSNLNDMVYGGKKQ